MNLKLMQKLTRTAGAALVVSGLAVAPQVGAVTPDNHTPVSGFWSAANTFKEYFDWRAFAGWGTVGATNVVITVLRGDSDGTLYRAAMTALCGSTASALLSTWKPVAAPTVASHAKAIMKSGSVVAAASACGWITQFSFEAINAQIPPAQNAINNSTPAHFDQIARDAAFWNNSLVAAETAMRQSTAAFDNAARELRTYDALGCKSASQSSQCSIAWNSFQRFNADALTQLQAFNAAGATLAADLKQINADVRS